MAPKKRGLAWPGKGGGLARSEPVTEQEDSDVGSDVNDQEEVESVQASVAGSPVPSESGAEGRNEESEHEEEEDSGPVVEDASLNYISLIQPRASPTANPYCLDRRPVDQDGHVQLADFIGEMLDRLDDSVRADLIGYLHDRALNLGTACSGTDCAVLVCKAFAKALNNKLGCSLQVNHIFSCESDSNKIEYLQKMFTNTWDYSDVQHIFANTADLASTDEGETVHDQLHQGHVLLPFCGDLVVGFPCQDVSRLNPNADRWVVRDASRRTGAVFADVMSYCKKMLAPKAGAQVQFSGLLLENVLGLATRPKGTDDAGNKWHSNLEYCQLEAERAGLTLIPFQLDPGLFSLPVSRQRIWMICLPQYMISQAQVQIQEVEAWAMSLMNKLCVGIEKPRRHLDDYLLPTDHELVRAQIHKAIDVAEKRKTAKPAKVYRPPKWAAQHKKAWQRMGRDWWQATVPAQHILDEYPGLNVLTERQLDMLALMGVEYPDKRVASVEVSQGLKSGDPTARVQVNRADIVTPSGMQLVIHQARCLTGYETLSLQNIRYGPDHQRLADMPDNFLRHLGGNAFEARCCAAALLVKKSLEARLMQMKLVFQKQEVPVSPDVKRRRTIDDLCDWS
ncbi:unnamed protein product [Symbiodinium sp. CCMP2592]|nr:unnamed protein product [Symbiodinium sp. CCMP2592]